MKFEQALQAMREGKRITRAEIYPTFYYMKADRLFKRDGEDGEEYEVEILHVDYCLMCEDWYLYEENKDKQKDNILRLVEKVENADFVGEEMLILCNCLKQQQQQITDIQKELEKIEKHIQYLIDKSVVEREKMQLSTDDKEQIALLQKQVKDLTVKMNYCNI